MSQNQNESVKGHEEAKEEFPELKKLAQEKIRLAKKLGLIDGQQPVEGYKDTKDYKRIEEIDARLWELV
ncbi:hypothetical protein MKY85_17535 [Paenibacillus sp. FSL R5-0749]|uniref:hypothetical protein n=1 Tax=Paenibacillus sp. FSL R5-0749 TaxID=2921657 RepID=UPI003159DDBF